MSSHASMNHIYRLVFNAATGMYVAVAETAKGRGKAGRSASAAMLAALTAIGGAGGLSTAGAQGLPTGGVAVTNNVSFSQTSNTLTMNQSGNAAIVNWNGFSIAAGNTVNINQQSTSAVMLNRVVGNSISEINGAINAIGKIMLVNQNGILMGAGAQVNTGGFLASTLNIKDTDFLAGKYIFDIANNDGGTAGTIINNGRINTPSGYAVLIAPQVTNNGFIAARQGTVAMGAGNKVSLDMVGDGLISLKVDQAALNAAVVNTGTIQANGGTVLLKASSANALFDTVINSTGIIRADSIANVNGRIILDGGAKGITEVSGEVTARGLNPGETGGSISVLGDKVGLLGNAKLDASGDAGGGTVLVGGNWQGNGPERNASRAIVASTASIDVSATGNGNGGTAVVWADGRTDMSGTIKATGGANGGNGGNVETSGKAALDLQGRVDITAANGQGGQWLLDPTDINIVGTNANLDAAVTSPNFQDDGGGTTATVSATALGLALTGDATVNVQTSNAGVGGTGAITVNSVIRANSASTLNLIANGAITLNAGITNTGRGALNVGLYAGSNTAAGTPATIATAGGQAGAIATSPTATITTGGGKVTMVSGSTGGITLNGRISTNNGDVTLNAGGALAVNAVLNAGTGTVRLQSTDAITQTGAITAANLGARGTAVDLTTASNAISTDVAINASAGAAKFKNSVGFNVGSVALDGTLFTATTGVRTSRGNNILLDAGGALAINRSINAGRGTVRIVSTGAVTQSNAGNVNSVTTGVRAASVDLSTSGGNSGNIAINASTGVAKYRDSGGFDVSTVAADGTFALTNGVTTNNQDITLVIEGALNVNNVINAGTGTVRLASDSAIFGNATGVITAANLAVRGTNTGATSDFDLSSATHAVSGNVAFGANTNVQNFKFKNSTGFNVGAVTADGALVAATTGISNGGVLTINAGGSIRQTEAISQSNANAINVTTSAGHINLSNTSNFVQGTVNLSAAAGGVAFTNNNSNGIKVGDITAATSTNSTVATDIANFTASDAALTGVVLLRTVSSQSTANIERVGATKIVADRTVLVAGGRIGGRSIRDATLGIRVEGAAGASARQVFVSAGATGGTTASIFGPTTAVPQFYNGLMNGATALPSPTITTYNGNAMTLSAASTATPVVVAAAAAATTPAAASTNTTTNTGNNEALRRAQTIVQIQQPKSAPPALGLNGITTPQGDRANNQVSSDLLSAPKVEPITIPSCAPDAARQAAPGQC